MDQQPFNSPTHTSPDHDKLQELEPHDDENDNPDIEDYDSGDDGIEKYRLEQNPVRPQKQKSENQRLNTAAFHSWLEQDQRQRLQDEISASKAAEDLERTLSDDRRPNENIICSPREYQVELFERAKTRNTIVVLDTGSGKTLIAALLMRYILNQELEERASGKPKRVAFFVAEKVALCFQQHHMLSTNLSFPIAKLHGDSPGMTSTKEFWDTQINDHMAVVCTAQVLLDGFNNGFLTMRQVNLLIFDEAHHAKKNHPFAKIIQSYYRGEPDPEKRPRIFGMTASPVDGQTRDMKDACSELEAMLDSRIATVSDEVLQANLEKKRLVETVATYNCLPDPEQVRTDLWKNIYGQISQNIEFRASLDFSKGAASTLGSWCADRFWLLRMTDVEVMKLKAKTQNEFADMTVQHGVTSSDAVTAIQAVQEMVANTNLGSISRNSGLLSSKVRLLWDILDAEFRVSPMKRCIVFVEKQFTAILLADLFQQPLMKIPSLKSAYMVGGRGTSSAGAGMSLTEQVTTLRRFREGDVSCLFATPVAEEGIDIPSCDLVIRFDLYNSVIQYIQSRGRARRLDSKYISMVEKDHRGDTRRLHQASRDAMILQQFCSALPEDRKVQDQLADVWAAAHAARVSQKIITTSSGARLSFDNSLHVVAKFVSSLSTRMSTYTPEFVVMPIGKKFIADINLPDCSPVSRISGYPQRSKQVARSSAAFEACKLLLEKKFINEHLQSTLAKKLPAMRNARLAVSSKKRAEYVMRVKPEIWSQLGDDMPLELFPTILALDNPEKVGRPTRPLILLSRQRLPQLPSVPLFFGDDDTSLATPLVTSGPFHLSIAQVESLRLCTLKIFQDIFSKQYEANCCEFPYFLAPEKESHAVVRDRKSATIDWDLVHEMRSVAFLDWENKPEHFYQDKFIVDPCDGSRKMILLGLNKNMKPSDPAPEDAPAPRLRYFSMCSDKSIKEYSTSLWTKQRKLKKWRDDQPVVDAEILSLRRNFLDQFFVKDKTNSKCAIILEPLQVSPIPVDVAFMTMLFPSILHRIDSALITLDACKLLDLDVEPPLALVAMTKDSDNTEDHGSKQINFQTGMGENYERLEFLGDTFLKMATTISIFTAKPDQDEFFYHVERMLLLCNRNLFNHAVDRGLQEYVRSTSFDRRSWYPNLKLLHGKGTKHEFRHNLADKSIADVCEALIGASYLSGQDGNMDMGVKAVTKMVKSKNHTMTAFRDYYANYAVPEWQFPQQVSAEYSFQAKEVGEKIGYEFRSSTLVRSASKHPSWTYDRNIPNYQQLEFLGDALLDMTIVDYLYRKFPDANPQWLTEHKMDMVSNHFLGFLCVRLGLQRHLLCTTPSLLGQISSYVQELEKAEQAMKQSEAGDFETQGAYWLGVSSAPKALPDLVEAIIGAMFVDSEYDFGVVRRFTEQHIFPFFRDMAKYDTLASTNPITVLEHLLRDEMRCNDFALLCELVPCGVDEGIRAITESEVIGMMLIHKKPISNASALNGTSAKLSVAKTVLGMIGGLTQAEYRERFGCNCNLRPAKK